MTGKSKLPFRAEHIGSLLRPPELHAARRAFDEGKIAIEALRAPPQAIP
jgi:5-methyltetrahydropteroyltriglutamate--homocysteine methyltransferase